MKDTKSVKKERILLEANEANEANIIAANVFLDSEKSPETELTVTRRDLENPLASIRMMGAGSNDFQGVLAFSTVNSGTPGGPLVERMRIHTNGYMGIGTTNPLCTLDVKGKAIKLGLEDNGGGQLFLTNNPNDNKIYLEAFNKTGDGNADELLLTGINAKNVPKLSLLADSTYIAGNVGIGTTTPQAKLDVAGNIRCGTSQTVNKETSIIFSGLNGDVDKIYELRLFGRMGTAGTNKNIRLGPNKIFDTSGFRNLTHRFFEVGNDAKSDLNIRNNGGLTLGFTDWNADGDIFIMARFYAATGKSRALEATHLYTNSASGADRELRGDHIGWWSDVKTNITSIVIDFNGGTFTGTALLTTVQP
ncbi:MAG: hypothetical protein OIN85_01550 [Candidatus Methanoperedens sp.]|nr:hypothetical protein [Candidatus Methanoperedens sp.]